MVTKKITLVVTSFITRVNTHALDTGVYAVIPPFALFRYQVKVKSMLCLSLQMIDLK